MPRDVSEIDLESYLAKPPTDLQERFAEWIRDQAGYDPTRAKTKEEAFTEGVRLSTALRMIFQASPQNQEVLEARRAEREEGTAAPAKAPKKAAAAEKATPAKKSTGKRRAVEVAEEEPEEEPAKPAKKAAAKKATASPTRNKRRAPAVTTEDDEEAPF